ncbi:MAG TPA: glycerophosphodiester phosphodiesterase family protein [bacterium]|nr:glycerophosphodiester phosphodiesterase family protein [bacterium]
MKGMNIRTIEIIAHRGAPTEAPENTISSFQLAAEAGADWIEFDVRGTSDGRAVVIHDAKLDRTTSGHGRVRNKTERELKELDAGSWFSPDFKDERIPTLDEALEWSKGSGVPVHIEFKDRGIEEFVIDRVRDHGLTGAVAFSSFNLDQLMKVRTMETAARLAPIIIAYPRIGAAAEKMAPEFIHLWSFYTLTRRQVETAGENHIDINAWLVDSPGLLKRVAARGVRGIITNRARQMHSIIKG